MPKEEDFYGLLEQVANFVIEGAEQLKQLLENYTNVEIKLQSLENLEHACDRVTHTTIDRLNETFITPFDREDIHKLVITVDDVLDTTEAAAQRMQMYRIKKPTEEAKKMGRIILDQAMHIHKAINALRDMRNFNQIMDHCVEIHRLENESDLIMKEAIGRLFDEEKDPLEIIRMKEVYQNLEIVSDRCEAVANMVQGISVKMH
jgi:predicted phosphate transport protein (TIGR00153 family)